MPWSSCLIVIAALAVSLSRPLQSSAKEKQEIAIVYAVAPERELPEELKAVAVIDSGIRTTGPQGDKLEKKWSRIAADMIEAMLLTSGNQFGTSLNVADRRATCLILAEQDLKLAGLVEGKVAAQAGKLLDVQGLVTSNITIHIDIQKGSKSTLDWLSIMGGVTHETVERRERPPRPTTITRKSPGTAERIRRTPNGRAYRVERSSPKPTSRRPGQDPRTLYQPRYPSHQRSASSSQAALSLKTKEVEEISRHLTVQCSFSLLDAATGKILIQYSPPVYQKTDKHSPDFLFGSLLEDAELDPVDHFIGELVERATQEFVGMIVPVQVEHTYEVVGKHDEGEAGVRALRAEDYAAAMRYFQAGFREDPDEHETVFAMGLTSELLGDFERALTYYRQAAAMEDVDKDELAVYLAAKNRLAKHLPRIIVPSTKHDRDKPTTEPN